MSYITNIDEVMNIWKSYMWTAEWRIISMKIIAVIYATSEAAKRKPEKKIQACTDLNPWPLRYEKLDEDLHGYQIVAKTDERPQIKDLRGYR